MTADKLLKHPGPLERLFGAGASAPVLDFLMLAAHENQAYSASEIARFSGVSPGKARAALSVLRQLGLVAESAVPQQQGGAGRLRAGRVKKYMLDRNSAILAPLEKVVLALTDAEMGAGPRPAVAQEAPPVDAGHAPPHLDDHGVGEAAAELVEKRLIRLDDQTTTSTSSAATTETRRD